MTAPRSSLPIATLSLPIAALRRPTATLGRRRLTILCGVAGAVGLLGLSGSGCLSRSVTCRAPTTKSSFTTAVPNKAVDKIDVLLAIDNSASMGDKQQFLAAAVPKLIERLITPNCVDDAGLRLGASTLTNGKATCASGKPEFEAINDIHIGIVSSSLGGLGGDLCAEEAKFDNNDHAHLLARTGGAALPQIEPSNFLAWYPLAERKEGTAVPRAGYTDSTDLSTSTKSLVNGAGERGCGLEAQLESVYHFLMAPDPWQQISVTAGRASYIGLDKDLLQQRKDFLRPDSLLAVIMLTDEDDSSADPLSVSATGFNFENDQPSGRPTASCVEFDPKGANRSTGPNAKACTSCAFGQTPDDPNCKPNGGAFTTDEDPINARFFHMKQRFGVDPQYPISRYVRGFAQKKVPARDAEHANGAYVGDAHANCTNPLFAKEVPDGSGETCNVALGDRDPNLVFFAIVGGVPNELLHFDPNSADNSKLTSGDWDKILGHDPVNFDYSGIDDRMVQSITARAGRPATGSDDVKGADPLNQTHRDWDTKGADLQYACTFALPSAYQKPFADGDGSFDCADGKDSPLCSGLSTTKRRSQIRAKAYPTVRELMVARALGDQGIAASLCPQETLDSQSAFYGYNPAVTAIVDRLKNALTGSCLPQKPSINDQGMIDCLMLEVLPEGLTTCDAALGKTIPDAAVATKFREGLVASGNADRAARTLCEVKQVKTDAGTDCSNADAPGWCYVQNVVGGAAPAGRCGQKVNFQKRTLANGSTVYLQCLDQSTEVGATRCQ